MGIIILFCIFLIINVFLSKKTTLYSSVCHDIYMTFFTFITLILAMIIIISSISNIGRTNYEVSNYYTIKQYVEYNKDSLSNLEKAKILDEVICMNKKINKNKTANKNFFIGIWYSKKIGNLKLLNHI